MGSLWIQAYRLNPSKPSSQESRGFNHGSVKIHAMNPVDGTKVTAVMPGMGYYRLLG